MIFLLTSLLFIIKSLNADYIAPSDIKRGCARFYLSNPNSFYKGMSEENTQVWTVCVPLEKDKPSKIAIGAGLFSKIKDKYGQDTANSISFISSGPDCWIEIFSGKAQTGETYTITPLSDVDLKDIPLKNEPAHFSFNDNIISGFIRSTDSAGENPESNDLPPGTVPIAVWYTFKNVKPAPLDNGCSYFYDQDPNKERSNGFVMCMSNGQHLAHLDQKDMHDRGFSDVIKGNGIKYVVSGPQVASGIYEHDNWLGKKHIIEQNDKKFIEDFDGKSIILISTKYPKEISPEEMFIAAEKFLQGK